MEKILGGKTVTIWDGIHGMIVDISAPRIPGNGDYRFSAEKLISLLKLDIRWIEDDGKEISIGF